MPPILFFFDFGTARTTSLRLNAGLAAAGTEKSPPLARSWRVPRYYFNVCCNESEATDVVGESYSDDLAALEAAFKIAGEVVHSRLFRNEPIGDGWIRVEDEADREVLTLPLRAAAY